MISICAQLRFLCFQKSKEEHIKLTAASVGFIRCTSITISRAGSWRISFILARAELVYITTACKTEQKIKAEEINESIGRRDCLFNCFFFGKKKGKTSDMSTRCLQSPAALQTVSPARHRIQRSLDSFRIGVKAVAFFFQNMKKKRDRRWLPPPSFCFSRYKLTIARLIRSRISAKAIAGSLTYVMLVRTAVCSTTNAQRGC